MTALQWTAAALVAVLAFPALAVKAIVHNFKGGLIALHVAFRPAAGRPAGQAKNPGAGQACVFP